MRDGEQFGVGDVTLTFLHTPGHTPEHVCVLAETGGQPARLFTGDLLFVGGVGRPDLLGEAQTLALATDLFDSLTRVMAMDGAIEVHPGHGAGSLCGAGIGKEPSSTIARERGRTPCCSTTTATRSFARCSPTFRHAAVLRAHEARQQGRGAARESGAEAAVAAPARPPLLPPTAR